MSKKKGGSGVMSLSDMMLSASDKIDQVCVEGSRASVNPLSLSLTRSHMHSLSLSHASLFCVVVWMCVGSCEDTGQGCEASSRRRREETRAE